MKTWNDRLALALSESDLKPNQLATVLKVSAPTVSAWIGAGSIKRAENITGENLLKVCRLLNIRSEWLILGEKPMRPGQKAIAQEPWPFSFSAERFRSLPEGQRNRIDGFALGVMAEFDASTDATKRAAG